MKYLWAALAAMAAIGAGAYYLASGHAPGDGAGLSFKGPGTIAYGEPFELSIGVSNASAVPWKGVSLAVSLPDGFVFADGAGSPSFVSRELGGAGPGSLTQASFEIVAVRPDAAPESLAGIVARLGYAPQGTSAAFEKEGEWQPPAPEEAVKISIEAPGDVTGGERFKTKVAYENAGEADAEGVSIWVKFPASFLFDSVNVGTEDSDGAGAIWEIGTLKKGASGEIAIVGRMGEATSSSFRAGIFRMVRGARRNIAQADAPVRAAAEPIALLIDANDEADYVARPGDTVTYTISYVAEDPVQAKKIVTISAMPSSPLFDFKSLDIRNDGIAHDTDDGQGKAIVWTVRPGSEGGSVSFKIKLKPEYGITRLADRNFVVKMRAEAKMGDVVVSASHEAKVGGSAIVGAKAYFRDAASGMANMGPYPPKVGQATEYTVHWTAKNYATDVRDVAVRAVLGAGVRCTGATKSTTSAVPSCDAETGQVSWNIGRMSATAGVLSAAPEAIFQVRLAPAADMVGKPALLMGPTMLTAMDSFASGTISSQAPELSTLLPDDPTASGQGIVGR